ncbi:Os03g0121950 [Oryza sativa Japonica Group]|uniref:Os03g0121950 protein n=1 Tax=Oryza sativa subsp. japonica TaxID=39947 RepID=A0A0P0VSC6_ORYSJ|nr:Os03g0121950 [Oryza sativa Japonica Group]
MADEEEEGEEGEGTQRRVEFPINGRPPEGQCGGSPTGVWGHGRNAVDRAYARSRGANARRGWAPVYGRVAGGGGAAVRAQLLLDWGVCYLSCGYDLMGPPLSESPRVGRTVSSAMRWREP